MHTGDKLTARSQRSRAASVEQHDGLAVVFDWKPQQLEHS